LLVIIKQQVNLVLLKKLAFIMNRITLDIPLQTFPMRMWDELPADTTLVALYYIDPLGLKKCREVCKKWDRFLTAEPVWKSLSHYHLPSMSLRSITSFQTFQTFCRIHFNFEHGFSLRNLKGHKGQVTGLAIKAENLFSCSADKTIKIWNLSTRKLEDTLRGHQGKVCSIVITGGLLVSGSEDKTIKIWNLLSRKCVNTLDEHQGTVNSVAASGLTLISGSDDKTVKIWDLSTTECLATLAGHTEKVGLVAIKDKKVFSYSRDATIRVWNLETRACEAVLKESPWPLSLIPHNNTLISTGSFTPICMRDLTSQHPTAPSFLPNGPWAHHLPTVSDDLLFCASAGSEITAWDLKTLKRIGVARNPESDMPDAICFQNGRLIFNAGKTIRVWDFTARPKTAGTR
jgi:WD40 repeat protein